MSVEFEPVRLGRRGRRIEPVAFGAVAVLFALGLAIIKPWAAGTSGLGGGAVVVEASLSPAASYGAVVDASATPDVVLPRVITARRDTSVTWDAIDGVVRQHDAWGIRTIVTQVLADSPVDARRRFVERWYPLLVEAALTQPVPVDSNDRAILALGVTFPPAHTPLDVRVWRVTDGGLEWVDIEALDPVPSGGAFLYRRPGLYPALPRTWESGEYRIDVLVEGGIQRFPIVIPEHFVETRSAPRPSLRDQAPLVLPTQALLSELPVGAFATVDGVAIPMESSEGPPLDEVGAWLDVDPGTGREPRSFVATEYLPRATGLGVQLPARSVVMTADVARLAPDELSLEPQRVDPGANGSTASDVVLFRAPGGGAWQPGVYRLSVRWADFDGLHDGSWHVELTPGPRRAIPRLLAAARGWARYAGETGVILGTSEPTDAGLSPDQIDVVPLGPDTAEYPVATGIGCGGTVILGHPGILGFAYAAEHDLATTVKGRIVRPFLRRDDQVLMTVALGIPGLVLAAPARISSLPAANYEFTVEAGDATEVYSLCLGMQSFDD